MGTQEVDLPVSPTAMLLQCVDAPYAFVLDGGSTASWGSGQALLGFRPRATLHVAADGAAQVSGDGVVQRWHGDPFALLDRFCREWGPPADGDTCGGGVVAALGYDLRHWVERFPRRRPDDLHLPVLYAAAYDWLLSYSYEQGRYRLASSTRSAAELRVLAAELAVRAAGKPLPRPLSETGLSINARDVLREPQHERDKNHFDGEEHAISARPEEPPFFGGVSKGRSRDNRQSQTEGGTIRLPPSLAGTGARGLGFNVTSSFTKDEYVHAVERSLDYIAAGDVYQVNLAQRFASPARGAATAPALFAALQDQHPMPFAAYVDAGNFALVSNSPECFLTVRQQRVATFPIKGTRARGADAPSDAALARGLAADPKERAEHVMIVDLERNDLGRVCRAGSVRVDAFAQVHSFPSLHHLVSAVSGELRPGVTLPEVLRATFPGGSITGAPKIRAMQIIDELKPVARGFYTGAVGFIGGGDAVFNIAIRTAVASRGWFTYHAGGGIVADSDPHREYDETLLKAQPFLAAVTAGVA